MKRKASNALLANERRALLALRELDGQAWTRPLLDVLDRSRDDDRRTGPGTLLRALTTAEHRGWVTSELKPGPLERRIYRLTEPGWEMAHALADLQKSEDEYNRKRERVQDLGVLV